VPLYPDLRIRRIGIKNVVASTVLFFELDLAGLCAAHPRFIHNIQSFWKGIVIQLKETGWPEYENRTATLLAYASGALVFTSMRGRADVMRIFRLIYPLLVPHAKPGSARWQTPLLQQRASKRDGAVDRQSEADELAVIVQRDSDNKQPDSEDALALVESKLMTELMRAPNKRKNNNEVALARNALALDTMDEHAAKKAKLAEERAAVLASLRATKTTPARRAPIMHTKVLDAKEAKTMINEQVNE
jgi:hypothetical protein